MTVSTYVLARSVEDAQAWALQAGIDESTYAPVVRPENLEGVQGRGSRMAVTSDAQANPLYRALLVEARRQGFEPPLPRDGFTDQEIGYITKKFHRNPADTRRQKQEAKA